MSLLTSLYRTYIDCEKAGLVDQTEHLNQSTVLLPVFHSNKKASNNTDILEVTLSKKGDFLKADFLKKDDLIIFPVTEDSIARSGSAIYPHMIADELTYITSINSEKKFEAYLEQLKGFADYCTENNKESLAGIVYSYLIQDQLLEDITRTYGDGASYSINKKRITIKSSNQEVTFQDKCFVTFKVENPHGADSSVSMSKQLHQDYIEYTHYLLDQEDQEVCSVSGQSMYCTSKHRGLLGNAKLVSVSNNIETYMGRISHRDKVFPMGYETSQKIMLMLKYLQENPSTCKYLGKNSSLITWSSNHVEEMPIDILGEQVLKGNQSTNSAQNILFPHLMQEEAKYSLEEVQADQLKRALTNRLRGSEELPENLHFYTLVVNKVSNGRIAVKYFRDIYMSDLLDRLTDWYYHFQWQFGYGEYQELKVPSFYRIAVHTFGYPEENKITLTGNTGEAKLNRVQEQLLPSIIDGKRIPLDIVNQMKINVTKRIAYDKNWNRLMDTACSIFKKYQWDYLGRSVSIKLDANNNNRSYLFGRLAAVYEGIETASLGGFSKDRKIVTNTEKYWSQLMRYPEKTWSELAKKVSHYKNRLARKPGLWMYYEKMLSEIISQLEELEISPSEKNRPVDENFMFGYYSQKQFIYTKSSEDTEEE